MCRACCCGRSSPGPTGTQATYTSSFVTRPREPAERALGGWYVTGTHGRQTHMGNVFVEDPSIPNNSTKAPAPTSSTSRPVSRRLAYLTPHSDIVAQLVLAHQTQMHNLITLTNFQTGWRFTPRRADGAGGAVHRCALRSRPGEQIERPAEELVRYLLFADEAPLDDPIAGTSVSPEEFAARGPRDPRGRSLRDFDLQRRIFKYPCSYLIYSDAFDALPEPARDYVYRRLLECFTGRDQSPEFARLSARIDGRSSRSCWPRSRGLPDEWKDARRARRAA